VDTLFGIGGLIVLLILRKNLFALENTQAGQLQETG
jgi:hypothetical protein